jgi:hypothetical protein
VTAGCVLQLGELGLLPEGDEDPVALADKLTQLAIDATDDQVSICLCVVHQTHVWLVPKGACPAGALADNPLML